MSIFDSLTSLRRDYNSGIKFDEHIAKDDPFEQFKIWFDDASKANFLDVNAMCLSTSTKDGKPSSRIVLLKQIDNKGLIFYTNYESRKGYELAENPYASLLFFWDKLERQIRIEGKVEKISEQQSYEYFKTRDYVSKLGAWASQQSKPLSSRFKLMRQVVNYMTKFKNEVPLPPHWGGYRLIPYRFEFWQGRKSRLHDRIQYNLLNNHWEKIRLYP